MKIYFAASVTNADLNRINLYNKIIELLSSYGTVLNNKIGDKKFQKRRKKNNFNKKRIHDFDLNLMLEAEVVIAEVSEPSLGVGYEIGRAIEREKIVLCICNEKDKKYLSPMIIGSKEIITCLYQNFTEIKPVLDRFFKKT